MVQHNTTEIIDNIFNIVSNELECHNIETLSAILTSVKKRMNNMLPFSIEHTTYYTYQDSDMPDPRTQITVKTIPEKFEGPGPAITYIKENLQNFEIRSSKYPFADFKILYRGEPVEVIHFEWGETLWKKNSNYTKISMIKLSEFDERYKIDVPTFLKALHVFEHITPELYKKQTGRNLEEDIKTELGI